MVGKWLQSWLGVRDLPCWFFVCAVPGALPTPPLHPHDPQVETGSAALSCLRASPTGEAWALGDASGCVRLWAEGGGWGPDGSPQPPRVHSVRAQLEVGC